MTAKRANCCDVAVIGAGPYGLSIAAHLNRAGIDARLFGEPMAFWRHNMPRGMMLRSPWRATDISNPDGSLSLKTYASQHGVNTDGLLPVEHFVAYGEWFQQHAAPEVDRRAVRLIDAANNNFRLTLNDGETLNADRVVVATGLRNQEYRPPLFRDLPSSLVSHACQHADLSAFRGKSVAVIGRGQSATESAALLAEAGAHPEIYARGDIHWLNNPDAPAKRTLGRALRSALVSPSEIGPFPVSWLIEWPALIRLLPDKVREDFVRQCVRPAASGWLKRRCAGIALRPAAAITGIRPLGAGVVLDFDDGAKTYDHVLLGTGYRIDIARLGILSSSLLEKIACADGAPILGARFESSVPHLHFVGSYAVKSYGPLLRFIAGAGAAARAVTRAARRVTQSDPDFAATPEINSTASHRLIGAAAPHLSPPR